MNITIDQIFDQDFYLSQYPEVAEAIANGTVNSPLDHYLTIGQFQGNLPTQLFNDVYVFGDSFSDDGNLFELTNGIFPEFDNFEGRFTNGLIWIETLIPELGLEINPENNVAYGGATTGSGNVLNPRTDVLPETLLPLPGIQTQIDDFVAENPVANPNALYMVWGGGNDYVGLSLTEFDTPITNLLTAIDKLADAGAKNIMVPNLFDLGAIPFAVNGSPEVQQRLAQATQDHNAALQIALEEYEQNSDINIIPVDMYSALNQAIENPAAFGFSNVTDAFLDTDSTNPDEFVFWNPIHPTVASHNLFANQAQISLSEVSEVLSIAAATQEYSPKSVPEPSSFSSGFAIVFAFLFLGNKLVKKAN
ncbi:MAG: SGNH/GDSL hydrolase family protein [Cyanobacteriota bacterium]|nr:SGNH/GDSL hydrolase family protein [Cyanobacteriota bacterium]